MRKEAPPLSLGSRAAFGIGSASESIFYIAFNIFCFFYFVQVLGLAGNLAGIAVAIALVFDAVSDPLVGYLSDRWKPGRLGRRHPFMFVAALPLGLSWAALFLPPDGMGQGGLFLWLLVFTVAARVSQTIFYVPHIAMGGEMSDDYTGRSRVFAWHAIFLWVGGAAVHFFGLRYFFPTENGINGMLVAENYPVYGVVWACVMMAVILVSTIFTMSRIPYLKKDLGGAHNSLTPVSSAQPFSRYMGEIGREMKEMLQNRNYVFVVTGLFCQALGAGVHETIITHMINYVWQLTTQQFSFMAFASMIGYAFGFVLVVPLHRVIGKRLVMVFSTLLMGVAHFTPVMLLLAGFPVEPGSDMAFGFVLAGGVGYYSGQSLMLVTIVSIIGDIADEHELNTGNRREGVLYSSRTLFSKMSSSLGHLVAGVLLTIIAFPLGKEVLPGAVEQIFLDKLSWAYVVLVPAPYVIAALVYMNYGIDKVRHAEILRQLADRDAKPAAPAT